MTIRTSQSKSPISGKLPVLAGLLIAAAAMLLAPGAAPAAAAGGAPGWAIQSVALPSNFTQGDNKRCEEEGGDDFCDTYLVTATNVGAKPSTGTITIKDVLPAGVRLYEESANYLQTEYLGTHDEMTCANEAAQAFSCTLSEPVAPGGVLAITIPVTVTAAGSTSATNHAEIEGGGADATARTAEPATVANVLNGAVPAFGVQGFAVGVYGAGGASDDQAGDRPDAVSTTIEYNTELEHAELAPGYYQSYEDALHALQEPRSEIVDLPLGFVGDPLAAEQCPESNLYGLITGKSCPAGSQVGTATIERGGGAIRAKIYNLVPEAGYPAMFGFEVDEEIVIMRARVLPTASGYVLSVSVPDVPRSTALKITGVTLTFFGDPAEQDGGATLSQAFFTNPSDCSTGPLKARLEMDSWVDPSDWVSKEATMYEASPTQGLSGCDLLQFDPTIEVTPEVAERDTPSGYEVDLRVPQAPNLYPALATPDLRNAEVTLPEGVSVSPGAADGLAGCQESGPEGIELGNKDPLGHEVYEGEEEGPDGLAHPAPGHCPGASQIGIVEIATPLLASPLKGHVYLAQPKCGNTGQSACTEASATNGELFGIYLEAAGSGVIVKVKGKVSANPQTGRLTTTFAENPQLPFSELKLRLTGGARASLANPQGCGQATTTSVLEPWSAPESGASATPFSSFDVSGCASAMPFAPGFLARTAQSAAGAASPFTVSFSRQDGEQNLSEITVATPPGLLGMLSEVQLCHEPQAAQGTCGPQSLIGATEVAAGAGSHPFWEPGNVYLTGPYKGQPFGLSVVTSTKAGPFNLGNVIVRAAIHVDPHTAAITITSDPLPQVIDGVSLRIQTVDVDVDKPGFMFNPTNCAQQSIAGTITSAQGATAGVSRPFAAAGCANLPFKPVFSAATAGKASKADGASLDVKIAAKGGPQPGGGEANIRSVKVDLPKQLPSRLTTLHKACVATVFEANPAACLKESDVGTATAVTPVLANPLKGPAYLVSHGGAAFPDLEIVLQGEGITLIVDGNTDIKKGITSSTFKTVPDAPVSSFELTLPTGPYSILGTDLPASAKYSLCGQTLSMPTAITGQNGAVLKQTTKIAISGCAKVKKLTRAQKLKAALKACHRDKKRSKRGACERRARRSYGPSRARRKHKKSGGSRK